MTRLYPQIANFCSFCHRLTVISLQSTPPPIWPPSGLWWGGYLTSWHTIGLWIWKVLCLFTGEEDSIAIKWMFLYKGEPKRCACGNWFKLVELDTSKFGEHWVVAVWKQRNPIRHPIVLGLNFGVWRTKFRAFLLIRNRLWLVCCSLMSFSRSTRLVGLLQFSAGAI